MRRCIEITDRNGEITMNKIHSGMERVTPTDRGTSADTSRLTGRTRTAIAPDQHRTSSKRRPHPTAAGSAQGNAGRRFNRYSTNGFGHASTVFGKPGATIIKLSRRISRFEARATARIDSEAGIEAASAILSEADIWKRNSMLAQVAMLTLLDVYGFEALILAPH
jgi:hypothetical protein